MLTKSFLLFTALLMLVPGQAFADNVISSIFVKLDPNTIFSTIDVLPDEHTIESFVMVKPDNSIMFSTVKVISDEVIIPTTPPKVDDSTSSGSSSKKSSGGGSSGGGGGGGSRGGGGSSGTSQSSGSDAAAILYNVEWDMCNTNTVRIIAGPVNDDLSVKLRTNDGLISANKAEIQPYPGRVVFDATLSRGTDFAQVQVENIISRTSSIDTKTVNFSNCSGSQMVNEYVEPIVYSTPAVKQSDSMKERDTKEESIKESQPDQEYTPESEYNPEPKPDLEIDPEPGVDYFPEPIGQSPIFDFIENDNVIVILAIVGVVTLIGIVFLISRRY